MEKLGEWNEYGRLILIQLEDLKKNHDDTIDRLNSLHTEVTTLKVKAGFWGFLAGSVGALIGVFMNNRGAN